MAQQNHTPESVLDELYTTGRRWMEARVDERRHGPAAMWATAGDNPPAYTEPDEEDRAADAVHHLRSQFRELAREFVQRMDSP